MGFVKAEPKQASLKLSMYGPPGSGKTFTALLMAEGLARLSGRRIAYIDTERGTDFYAQPRPSKVHPDAFEFDAIYTRSLKTALDEVRALDPKVYGVLIVDSISHIWEAAIEAYSGKRAGKDGDKIPMPAWGGIKRPYKELLRIGMDLPMHLFVLGRQKNVFDTEGEEWHKVGVAMRAEGETQYEPHICLRMSMAPDGTILAMAEKDRTGVLSGRTITNPNFDTLAPLLPLLGNVQAHGESDEERIDRDAELQDEMEQKAREKDAKSGTLFDDLRARIEVAATIEQLGAIEADAKKKKRSLSPDHVGALRLLFQSRMVHITSSAVGSL